MMRNIGYLFRVQLKGDLGVSEGLNSPDERKWKKSAGTIVGYIVMGVLFFALSLLISLSFASMGFVERIPSLVAMFASVLIFIFNVFKAGASLFSLHRFEMEAALPVTTFELVASKFLSLYVVNLAVAVLVAVPGLVVCGMYTGVSALYVVFAIIGILFLPLIPLAAAIAIGALLYAVSARLRFRKLVITILGLAAMLVLFIAVFRFNMSAPRPEAGGSFMDGIALLLAQNFDAFTAWYVPGTFLSAGVMGNLLEMLFYVLISIGLFAAVLAFVTWKYLPICQAMQVKDAKHDYVMTAQQTSSVAKALFKRDFKRYISSTTYVFNTLFGYILMVVMACVAASGSANLFGDPDGVRIIYVLLPLGLSMLAAMSSTTPASLSMEGRSWWLLQTLPVTPKDVFKSKIRVNLLVALPFYLVSVIIISVTMQPNIAELAALILLPAAYIFFISVFGMKFAVKHSNFGWTSETEAVKQGMSLLFSMLIAFGTLVVALVLSFLIYLPVIGIASPADLSASQQILVSYGPCLVLCGVAVVIGLVAFLTRSRLYKKQFSDIIE